MRIIISPAKKMNIDTDSLPWCDLPVFLPEAKVLFNTLKRMSYGELKKLWECNDQIASQNQERLDHMDLRNRLTPAILAYEGIQYRYIAPGVFSDDAFSYIQEHLRILSGLYGILRPLDGITPYRLEMQAKLRTTNANNLYDYWGDRLAKHLLEETDCIINLASKEYSMSVCKHLPKHVKYITCMFGEEVDGKILEKGTLCKMARGEMVRFLAEKQISVPEDMKAFDCLSYHFDKLRLMIIHIFLYGVKNNSIQPYIAF